MRIASLWRYPVKSMRGERVRETHLTDLGVAGDRAYGLLDRASGTVLSAKREGRLLEAEAILAGSELMIRLPTGETTFGLGTHVDEALGAWLGRPVHLVEAVPGGRATYENLTDFTDDGSEPTSWEGPPGSFVDACPVHLLSTASLRTAGAERPDLQWDVARFRPNLVVEVEEDGMPEQGWAGGDLAVGQAVLSVWMGCPRCVMTTRAQPGGLGRQLDVFRHVLASHGGDFGVLAGVKTGGRVAEGDAVLRM